ncbi:alginate lyase family protein [Bacillus sp. REN16]|uniref:alginate lyase family protein n=1 Tax=Bacillus sp. REN16 TaxID=2887296 RepID=UPI001E3DA30E|nr:alginate lyase family protein [Bacillus sp. REN16]MCC3355339.1 heparinase II/III family protein [Bacillus sp. REN16]
MGILVDEEAFLREAVGKYSNKETEETLHRAKLACKNTFIFTHPWDMERCEEEIHFPKSIDWTYCFNGDEEWAFMLNRQRFMAEIGMAYLLEKNEEYVTHWKRIFYEWVKANEDNRIHPYTFRKIDAGIRVTNWLKGYQYIQQSPLWDESDNAVFLQQLKEHGNFLSKPFRAFDFQSNWGFLELNGLIQAAFLMDEDTRNQWINESLQRINKMIPLQIYNDGYQKEQSPMYHHEVLHCLVEIKLILEKNKYEVPYYITDAANRMYTASFQLMKPNRHQPMLGDSDDTDLRGILATGAVLLNRPDLKSLTDESFMFEALWYFGKDGLQRFHALKSKEPLFTSANLADSGVTVFRSGWAEQDEYLLFDHGIMGHVNKGHGHDDTLHIELMAGGREFLMDGGRYTYCETEERKYYKEAKRHNTITVDGFSASEYVNTWEWKNAARQVNEFSRTEGKYQYAEAGHTGYWRLESPVHVTRKMIYCPSKYWFVLDIFQTNGVHNYEQYLHFPEKTPIEWTENGELTTTYPNGTNLKIIPLNLTQTDHVTINKGKISRHYNKETSAPSVLVQYKDKGSFVAPFLMMALTKEKDVKTRKLEVSHLNGAIKNEMEAVAYEISIDGKKDILVFSLNGADSLLVEDFQLCGETVVISEQDDRGFKIHNLKA